MAFSSNSKVGQQSRTQGEGPRARGPEVGKRTLVQQLEARGSEVGKRTLVQQVEAVMLRSAADGAAPAPDEVVQHAQDGLTGSVQQLPYLDRIQASFGRHDVTGVQAHVGGPATEAAKAMGARAYATGSAVAFGAAPDLHTAAHEAAHVVQQRAGVHLAGSVGREGDPYERHADAVADLVVKGESSESLLDVHAGGTPATAGPRTGMVQLDKGKVSDGEDDPSVGKIKKPTFRKSSTVHWYTWSDEEGFKESKKTVAKGTKLKEARPTIYEEFAWVETEGGEQGYLHSEHLSVTAWGPKKNPRYEDKNHLDRGKLLTLEDGSKDSPQSFQDTNREWYLDQAVLMDAFRSLEGKDPETQKKLALAMLQSFSKTAAIDRKEIGNPLGIQTSPFGNDQGVYHRSGGGNRILDLLRDLIAKDMDIAAIKDAVQVVSDPMFMEVLAREFPVYGAGKGPKEKSKNVDTQIDSISKFESSVDALLDNYAAGHAPETTFVFNVSQLYVSLKIQPKDLQTALSRPLEQVFTQKAVTFLDTHKETTSAELVKALMDKIQLVIMTTQKGVNVLLTAPFFKPLTEEERKKGDFTEEQIALHDQVDRPARATFTQPGGHDDKKLDSAMIESGARIDPIAAKAAMLEFATPEVVLAKNGIKVAKLDTRGKKDLTVCKDIKAFLGTGVFKSFRALSEEEGAPPYQKIYPVATADLLAGLAECSLDDDGIDAVFQAKQITEVLQTAYYRMMNAMAGAIQFKSDLIKFLNEIELIHDQLQMILTITEPHAPEVAFSEGITTRLKSTSEGESPTVPEGLDPQVHHKASAMHSVSSVMSSVEEQKAKDHGTRELNTLVLKDNYYETAGAVHNAKTHKMDVLDGDKLRDEKGAKTGIEDKSFESGKKPDAPIDLFICDFHHNISIDRQIYRVEDVTHQVDELFDKGLVANKFTVAIDCTVDFLKSEDIKKFLHHNEGRITAGKLNVVLFRSAQKFDMLGMDNYYGGFTVTINDGASFSKFNERISKKEDQASGLSHQGMAHLAKFGGQHVDEYRRLLMENTQRLYTGLPEACKYAPGSSSPLQIAQTEDPNAVFLDIQFPGYTERLATGSFYLHFITWCHGEGLALTTRPSFGFATSNFTTIAGSKVRLNPGLESGDAIAKYISYFTKVQQILAETQKLQLEALGKAKHELTKEEVTTIEDEFKTALQSFTPSKARK